MTSARDHSKSAGIAQMLRRLVTNLRLKLMILRHELSRPQASADVRRARFLDRFDRQGSQALEAAEQLAIDSNSVFVDTSHLLVGLLETADDEISEALTACGLSPSTLRAGIEGGFTEAESNALEQVGVDLDRVIGSARSTFGTDAMSRSTRTVEPLSVRLSYELSTVLSAASVAARIREAKLTSWDDMMVALLDPSLTSRPTRALRLLGAAGCDVGALRRMFPPNPTAQRKGIAFGVPGRSGLFVDLQRRLYERISRNISES